MADLFNVIIKPVTPNLRDAVKLILMEQLGTDSEDKAIDLMKNGGLFLENADKASVKYFTRKLRNAGAVVKLERVESTHQESFSIRLTSAGNDSEGVIKKIREITGLSQRESKTIVLNLDIIAKDLDEDKAEEIKIILESVGATVQIEEMSGSDKNVQPSKIKSHQIVLGKVLLESGQPAVGLDVKVYAKTLKLDKLLAETSTNNQGVYKLRYSATNIIVRVFNEGSQEPIAESDIVLKARKQEKVNLTISKESYQGLSLYETIERDISPHLGEVAISKLSTKETSLLASDSGIAKEQLVAFQQAHKIDSEMLTPEVRFALALQKEGVSEKEIVSLSSDKLKHAVATSMQEHIIPKSIAATLGGQLAAHERENIKFQLTHSSFASNVTLKEVWSIAEPTESQFETLAINIRDKKDNPTVFWEEIKNDLPETLVSKLKWITQLNNLTFGDISLVNKLSENNSDYSLKNLAGLNYEKWGEITGGATQEKIAGMKRMVDYLHPTQNIFASYATDIKIPIQLKADIATFYKNNPDFNFARSDYLQLLEKNPDALAGVVNTKELEDDILKNIRLYDLLPEIDLYQHLTMLRDMGMTSAFNIVDQGFSGFIKRFEFFGGDSESAKSVYVQAQHKLALINVYYVNWQIDTQVFFYVFNSGIRQTPEWKTFFGSEDFCECQHCKSIFSPAAYLTDCLHFLENRKLPDGETAYDKLPSVYDELNRRRPDIKHILLNCENAETPMPYIDLVNEVLETVVESESGLESNKYQTTGTTEQLLANPENQDIAAYTTLKEAVYPWSMPFDFYNQLGKTYLKHLGVQHHKLVSLFPVVNENLPENRKRKTKAILALNETDWLRIVGRNYRGHQNKLWGIKDGETVSETKKIKVFLQKSQLNLDELRELVNSRYLNSNGGLGLKLNFLNPCSLEGATIDRLNTRYRQRIIPMIRLQQKLKVDIRTLDHILIAMGVTRINSRLLDNVAQLKLWHEEYNIPYAELISWIGVLPTAYSSDENNHKELYEKLFLSGLEEADVTKHFLLNAEKTALTPFVEEDVSVAYKSKQDKAAPILNYILGALKITSAELSVLTVNLVNTEQITASELSIVLEKLENTEPLNTDELAAVKEILVAKKQFITDELAAVTQALVNADSLTTDELVAVKEILAVRKQLISDVLATVTEALVNSQLLILTSDQVALVSAILVSSKELDGNNITLVLLSRIYGHLSLSRSLNIEVNELFHLAHIIGFPTVNTVDNILKLIEFVNQIRLSGLSIQQALFLFDKTDEEHLPINRKNEILQEIREGLWKFKNQWEDKALEDTSDRSGIILTEEYSLKINSVDSVDNIVSEGSSLIIVTLVEANLYIRIFNANGEKVIDKAENELLSGEVLTNLKQRLNPLPDETSLSRNEKQEITESAKFIADFALPGYVLSIKPVDIVDEGSSLMIVTLVENNLYIRIFDTDGGKVIDMSENELLGGGVLTNLKQQLIDLPEGTRLSQEEMQNVFESAVLITGFVFLADPLTEESFIFEKLSTAFGIDRNNIIRLLSVLKNDSTESYLSYTDEGIQKSYLDLFLSESFSLPDSIASAELEEQEENQSIFDQFPNIDRLFDLLHKISILFNSLDFQNQHYRSLISSSGRSNYIDFNNLNNPTPFENTEGVNKLYDPFVKLLKINEVIKETASSTTNLFDLLFSDSDEIDSLQTQLIELFDYSEILPLAKTLGSVEADYSDPELYLKLLSAMALEKHLGIYIADYVGSNGEFLWAQSELEQAQVAQIVQVAKAKYGDEKWQTVTQQLRNDIREQQRDALLAYITANNNTLNTAEKLYAELLLDVEMNSRTITSRIKLALSSVQLFVQRCLMNLETNVSLQGISDDERLEWEEWSWRKNYRVWEANRRVFLYPENWLEPEWRDDKTPFFKELETELQQNELTDIYAEKAYLSYLAKLESVNNLEIMAMCDAEEIDNKLTGYYIFGRTHGIPKTLYFRKYELDTESFTAWGKIDIDFEGEHLVPAIHKGRLHLFWPVFGEKLVKENKDDEGYTEPKTLITIQLAWTQFYNQEWIPRKLTEQSFELDRLAKHPNINVEKKNIYITYDLEEISIFIGGVWDEQNNNWVSNRKVLLNFSGNSPVAQKNDEYDLLYPDQVKIDFSSLLGIENQRSMTDRYFNGAARIYLNGSPLIYNIKQQVSFITFPNEKPWNSNNPLIIQIRDISVLLNRKYIDNSIIPLQTNLYSTLSSEIGTYGVRSAHVYSFWKDYQHHPDEEFSVSDVLKVNKERLNNPDAINRKVSLHSSPAFTQYTWELFFHIPMHIANKLRQDQKFEEAQQWFHYVFNPTSSEDKDTAEKFWLFLPFRDYLGSDEEGVPKNIQELMRLLNKEAEIEGDQYFESNVQKWERNPFSPHTVARSRIVAYMKWVVMRYIDNIIEWADQLFRRDSIESLNEATQLYMLAWNILGGEPQTINKQEREDKSYQQLKELGLDQFSNVMIKLETAISSREDSSFSRDRARMDLITPVKEKVGNKKDTPWGNESNHILTEEKPNKRKVVSHRNNNNKDNINLRNLYFCIPQNEKLLGYWSLVSDRFFKLRNSLNIEGVYRQLPLYEHPIDPALLIKAKAAGLSIADALSAQYQPRSHYRFLALLQKAVDYANDVRVFGGALLSAMEKRDAERISVLRSLHEVQLLDEATFIRKEQINELKESNIALGYSFENIVKRRDYYADKEYMSVKEKSQMVIAGLSQIIKTTSQVIHAGAAVAKIAPDYQIGYSGVGGFSTVIYGGSHAGSAADSTAKAFAGTAGALDLGASILGQLASYDRREEEWDFQESTAEIELKQIEKQILASEIRMAIAQQELKNHTLQVENSKKQLELVQTKFTNAELYEWMVGQLKTLYFQSYQMAFDMAKKAEHALGYEFGIGKDETETFIQFGQWDKAKQGLLSGEKLHHDLKRMEAIYMQRNKRKQEVTQTFSLAMINPAELLRLRKDGSCTFETNKILFDLANYRLKNRKVKSVSLTIPAVTGSYTGVHAILSNGSERITTSSGQNDSGLFQFNFNDERYLPFEGIDPCKNPWGIKMNDEYRAFDYNTISDVLLHINYTAEYDEFNKIEISDEGVDLGRYFSLKHEFSDEWYKAKGNDEALEVVIDKNMFPFAFQSVSKDLVTIQRKDIALNGQIDNKSQISLNEIGGNNIEIVFDDAVNDSKVLMGTIENINNLEDIILIVAYKLKNNE